MTALERMHMLLKEKDLSLKNLSAHLGIAYSNVRVWKSKHEYMPIKHVVKIADFLNVSVKYLLTGEPEEYTEQLTEKQKELLSDYSSLNDDKKVEVEYYTKLLSHNQNNTKEDTILIPVKDLKEIETINPDGTQPIVKRIIEQLEKSGLSKKEFAEKINISPSMVTKWTTTSSMPKLEYIEKICQILNTNVEYIITGKGTDESHELQLDKKLKKDEKELIKKYRKLSRKEKSKMIAIANYFINSYRTETENERGDCIG